MNQNQNKQPVQNPSFEEQFIRKYYNMNSGKANMTITREIAMLQKFIKEYPIMDEATKQRMENQTATIKDLYTQNEENKKKIVEKDTEILNLKNEIENLKNEIQGLNETISDYAAKVEKGDE